MTYYESAEGEIITLARTIRELKKHGVSDLEEFFRECGRKAEYLATDVLAWLGY